MDEEPRLDAAKGAWLVYAPIAFIVFWWLQDLQFQWRSLVEYQYGWIVLLLTIYLIWERWPRIPDDDSPAPFWLGAVFALAGTPFVLVAELYKQAIARTAAVSFSLSVGCLFFLSANVLYLHGWKTLRHFLFPLAFFFLAVPLPGILWNPVILGLQHLVTTVDVEVLNLVGIPAVQQTNVIQLPHCVVGVNEACSGIRSLQSSIMAGLFVGNVIFRKSASRFVFFGLALVFAFVGNCLRSLFLSLVAHGRGVEALDRFHDAAGWSVFIFTSTALIGIACFMTRIERLAPLRIDSGRI
jgi:exosortase